MTDLLEVLRAVNCPLLALAFIGLVLESNDALPKLPVGWRVALVGFGILLLAGATGSAIKYLNGVPVDLSILFVTIGGLLILGGLVASRHFRR